MGLLGGYIADLIKSSENSELYKSLWDPLGFALVWCDDLKTDEVTFKDPESIPGQLRKSIEEAARLISETTLKPPYQQQVCALVVRLQKLTAVYLISLDVTENTTRRLVGKRYSKIMHMLQDI